MRLATFLGLAVLLSGCVTIHPPKPFADEVPSSPPIARLEQPQKSQVVFLNTKEPRSPGGSVPLRAGEVVMTNHVGGAQVKFYNNALSRLAPHSRVLLKTARSLKLEEGAILASSPDFLQIETHFGRVTATNAVIYVQSSPDRWQFPLVLVLRGKAQSFILDSDVKVELTPGQELNISPWGIPIGIKKLTTKEKQGWLKRLKQQFKFNEPLPREVVFLETWQKPELKPAKKPSTPPKIPPPQRNEYYETPYYTEYYEEPYYPSPTKTVRATPPPPPIPAPPPAAPVFSEPPPLPVEPEVIPVETPPVATEPIPIEEAPNENTE